MNLSKNFTLDELTRSDYAIRNDIDNTPSADVIMNLTSLCREVLEPLQELVKRPIQVTSGYRSPLLNRCIGGAKNSQHVEGKAVDIVVPKMTVDELFDIASKFTNYDQCIWEFGKWVHISYNGTANRKQKYWAVKVEGKSKYLTTAPVPNPT